MREGRTAREADRALIAGRYLVERPLAEGGMGAVFQVHDELTGARLALKRMHENRTPLLARMFEREYLTLASLHHPRIVRVFDFGFDAGVPFYTMELVQGRDLSELAPVPFQQACRYLRDIATCLALLHTRRLLHRDITPRNVRVTEGGACKLLDFGALTPFGEASSTVVGTPPFIPPEALQLADLDQRCDLFSFGALAYWILTRHHAFPARTVEELPLVWKQRPAPPSQHNAGVPKGADVLILSLLKLDPIARPTSMAEVVDRLNVLGGLAPEEASTERTLAESYFVNVHFTGRDAVLSQLTRVLQTGAAGGNSVMVVGRTGSGRSRLLHELVLRAQLSGARCVRVDAAMHPHVQGTALAIARQLQVFEGAQPIAAGGAARPEISDDLRARTGDAIEDSIASACRAQRLLLAIDNMDRADEASLALLVSALNNNAVDHLSLVATARSDAPLPASISWRAIWEKTRRVDLHPLTSANTLEIARSLFGDAPNVGRFVEWLYEPSAGLPLHWIELVRKLHADGEVRYADGLWVLPPDRPDVRLPNDLHDIMAERLSTLSGDAYAVAEVLAMQDVELTRERCAQLASADGKSWASVSDELIRADVLEQDTEAYCFQHLLSREVLIARMLPERKRALHLACAARALREGATDAEARLSSGWHLLQSGERARGADMLAELGHSLSLSFAFLDLQAAAPAIEAALQVYKDEGRSLYARLPLLCALAQAGYYEDPKWAVRYGEEALAAVNEAAGLNLARRLQPKLGRVLGLGIALLVAFVRFVVADRNKHSFKDLLVHVFNVITTLTGSASLSLDYARAERVAATMTPFMHLPKRQAPVGIGLFCGALKEIARENQSYALDTWRSLSERFADLRFYTALPAKARSLYIGGLWFARGVFESFRDAGGALEAAAQLDKVGLRMYRMIASELRMLHYVNRADLRLAKRYRDEVEVHAIHFGSAAQVELWEPAALILPFMAMGDLVELRRLFEQLSKLAETAPSLVLYRRLARQAWGLARHERIVLEAGTTAGSNDLAEVIAENEALLREYAPRSFIGWAALSGYLARALNLVLQHEKARALCLQTMSHLEPADRPFVMLFLTCEIELAVAETGCGQSEAGARRLDELIKFHAKSDNPLTHARLHEGYVRHAALAGDWETFSEHLAKTREWCNRTGAQALISRVEAFAAIARRWSSRPAAGANREQAERSPSDPPTINSSADKSK